MCSAMLSAGNALEAVLKRIAEKENEARRLTAAIDAVHRPTPNRVHLARIDGLLANHIDRFGELMRGDVVRARQALQRILAERIRFTPLVLPSGQRTYQLEATLSLGGLLRAEDCSKGNVPNGS